MDTTRFCNDLDNQLANRTPEELKKYIKWLLEPYLYRRKEGIHPAVQLLSQGKKLAVRDFSRNRNRSGY